MTQKKKEPLYETAILLALPIGFNPDERIVEKHVNCHFCNENLWLSPEKVKIQKEFFKENKNLYILCAKCIAGWHHQTSSDPSLKDIVFDVEDIEDYTEEEIIDVVKNTIITKKEHETNPNTNNNKTD